MVVWTSTRFENDANLEARSPASKLQAVWLPKFCPDRRVPRWMHQSGFGHGAKELLNRRGPARLLSGDLGCYGGHTSPVSTAIPHSCDTCPTSVSVNVSSFSATPVDRPTRSRQYLDAVRNVCLVARWGRSRIYRPSFPSAQPSLGRSRPKMWPFGSSGSDKPPAAPKPSPAENKQIQDAKKAAAEFDPAKLPEREKLPTRLQKLVDSDKDDFFDELYEG